MTGGIALNFFGEESVLTVRSFSYEGSAIISWIAILFTRSVRLCTT